VAFLFGALMILALGADPIDGLVAMVDGAFGTRERLATTAVRAAPLLLVGTGITVAFRSRVINIGGEGQIVIGALLATAVALSIPGTPRPILLPLVLIASMIGGGIWGAIPGFLKAYASVNEILSTIMLNLVAVQVMNYLLRGPMIDPNEVSGSRIPQTERLTDNAALPTLLSGTRLHLGVVIAIVAAVVAWIVLWHTPLGFRLRAVGHNPDAARASGISVERNIVTAMAISGSLSGLAGAVLVFGSESLRMVTDGSTAGFTGSAGFNGIVAALFGGLHPLWTIPSAFLFGSLLTGANNLQRVLQIPSPLAVALNGIVVIFVVSSGRIRTWLERVLDDRALAAGGD
jgi:general nucleoside transport system permease protein